MEIFIIFWEFHCLLLLVGRVCCSSIKCCHLVISSWRHSGATRWLLIKLLFTSLFLLLLIINSYSTYHRLTGTCSFSEYHGIPFPAPGRVLIMSRPPSILVTTWGTYYFKIVTFAPCHRFLRSIFSSRFPSDSAISLLMLSMLFVHRFHNSKFFESKSFSTDIKIPWVSQL